MARLLIVIVVVAAAVAVAWWVQRRRPAATPVRTGWAAPDQLRRDDFARPDAPWLVAVFTSGTCSTCADVMTKAHLLESDAVAVQELEYSRDRELHERYVIDAVPTLVVADAEGVVRHSSIGPVSSTHLWAALAELRDPGTVPPGCHD